MIELPVILQYGSFGVMVAILAVAGKWFVDRDRKEQELRAEERKVQQAQIAKDREFLQALITDAHNQQDKHAQAWQTMAQMSAEHIRQNTKILAEIQCAMVDSAEQVSLHDRAMRELVKEFQRGTG